MELLRHNLPYYSDASDNASIIFFIQFGSLSLRGYVAYAFIILKWPNGLELIKVNLDNSEIRF